MVARKDNRDKGLENNRTKNEGRLLVTDNPRQTAEIMADDNMSGSILSHLNPVGKAVFIERDASGERFVQIGVTALRNPATGEFLPAEPMYVKIPRAETGKSGLPKREETILDDISQIAMDVIGSYIKLGGLRAGT